MPQPARGYRRRASTIRVAGGPSRRTGHSRYRDRPGPAGVPRKARRPPQEPAPTAIGPPHSTARPSSVRFPRSRGFPASGASGRCPSQQPAAHFACSTRKTTRPLAGLASHQPRAGATRPAVPPEGEVPVELSGAEGSTCAEGSTSASLIRCLGQDRVGQHVMQAVLVRPDGTDKPNPGGLVRVQARCQGGRRQVLGQRPASPGRTVPPSLVHSPPKSCAVRPKPNACTVLTPL